MVYWGRPMSVSEITTIDSYRQVNPCNQGEPVQRWIGKAAPDHAQEWLKSGVDPGIIGLNVETLTDTASQPSEDSLFPIAERLNWNLTRFGQQTRTALRGWWVSGIDPFTGRRMTWGRFKPDAATPVLDREKQQPAKYLSPALGPGSSRLVLLDVPALIWQRVAQRYQVALPIDRSEGFWHWVKQQQIPVVITEGEKKAGCLLSLGYAAIALPGIFTGYRRQTGQLIPELQVFATPNRAVYLCFDFDIRPTTLQNIQLALTRLGQLLQTEGCSTHIICLPGPEKGVDDYILSQGAEAFDALYQQALSFRHWQAEQQWALTYPIAVKLNQPYLSQLSYPNTGLVCIKSPKGTGKTTALQQLIQQATQTGRKVLVITHRIQLGRAICRNVGIHWIEEIQSETTDQFSYGLCIDSLHSLSQARFNPQYWQGAIVVIDEFEQVIWHVLNSATCYEHRVKILETLRQLVQTVLTTQGLLIAQDADLSNVGLDYILGLAEQFTVPWIVLNEWQPQQAWQVHFYETPNPAPLISQLIRIAEDSAVYVCVDSQKSQGRWSSKTLETYLKKQLPHKRILRIDSETVTDPSHPAHQIAEHLNAAIIRYDIVIATPTIGTGISIDHKTHFKAVFGIFQGVIPDSEARQALARVRSAVPRYIWAAPFGPGKVGNGSCNYQEIANSTTRFVKYNIALLKDVDFDIDRQTDPITLRTWARMAARVNASLWKFRQRLIEGLELEGHNLTVVGTEACPELVSQAIFVEMSQVRNDCRVHDAIAVSSAPEIQNFDYELLKDQRSKTWLERCAIQKHELKKRYAIPVTSDLKMKDDEGWFQKLRLHYYLIHNSEWVKLQDRQEWQLHLNRGNGKVVLQDIRLLTAQVEALKGLGILNFLDLQRQVRATDSDVQQVMSYCLQYKQDIKTLFNLTVSERMSPIEIVQALLSKLGLKLNCIRRDRAEDGRRGGLRVYQFQPPQDDREMIFKEWQKSDRKTSEKHILTLDANSIDSVIDPPPDIVDLYFSAAGSEHPGKTFTSVSDSQPVENPSVSTKELGVNPVAKSAETGISRYYAEVIRSDQQNILKQLTESKHYVFSHWQKYISQIATVNEKFDLSGIGFPDCSPKTESG